MLRFVVAPDGQVVVDIKGRLPGRGLWLTPTPEAFAQARAKRGFERAARAKVRVADTLEQIVVQGLEQAVLEQLGMLRRAGRLVLGFEKAKAALQSGKAKQAWSSRDASASSLAKFLPSQQTRAALGLRHEVLPFDSQVLGAHLGRAQTNFLALSSQADPRRLHELLRFLESLQPLVKPARPMTDRGEQGLEADSSHHSVSPRP